MSKKQFKYVLSDIPNDDEGKDHIKSMDIMK